MLQVTSPMSQMRETRAQEGNYTSQLYLLHKDKESLRKEGWHYFQWVQGLLGDIKRQISEESWPGNYREEKPKCTL